MDQKEADVVVHRAVKGYILGQQLRTRALDAMEAREVDGAGGLRMLDLADTVLVEQVKILKVLGLAFDEDQNFMGRAN